MTSVFNCTVNSEHLLEIYEIYDDHNFSFAVDRIPGVSEVAGTDKCIVSVEKPEESTMRPRMRGRLPAARCLGRGGPCNEPAVRSA